MENKNYPKESIKTGWNKFKSQPWLWVGITLLVGIPNIIADLLEPAEGVMPTAPELVGMFILSIISFVFSAGLIKASLDAIDSGEKVEVSDLWSVFDRRLISLIGSQILAFLIMLIPMALIFGGAFIGFIAAESFAIGLIMMLVGLAAAIYLAIRLVFVQYGVIDESMTAVPAIKHSFAVTKANLRSMVILGLMIGVLNLLGALALMVGLLVTVPITAIAVAYYYRQISGADMQLVTESVVNGTHVDDILADIEPTDTDNTSVSG